MKKLLVICGPTATGKTSLAILLAKKYGGELISADSRQVYKGMDIGTGKDLPKGLKLKGKRPIIGGYYLINGIKVWGYDLVNPKDEFSVAHYEKIAKLIVKDILKRKKIPILVGGTGLYIQSITRGIPTVNIPKNKKLRKTLSKKSVKQLYDQLAMLEPIKAASMNVSDRKNPRRLTRAIEIALWKTDNKGFREEKEDQFTKKLNVLKIGLKLPRFKLSKIIKKRVLTRVNNGFSKEVKNLLKAKVSWKNQAMDSIGYKLWKEHLDEKISKDKVIEEWTKQEIKYAKRQMTWFKKDKKIKWFNSSSRLFPISVEKTVDKWYNS